MPELNGLEAARQVHKEFPKIGILILTLHFSDQLLTDIVEAGARAYVMKLQFWELARTQPKPIVRIS